MIGLTLLISIIAVIIALVKNSKYKKQVIVLTAITVVTILATVHFTNRVNTNNPFAAIGPAVIGSVVMLILSLTALMLAFYKKR